LLALLALAACGPQDQQAGPTPTATIAEQAASPTPPIVEATATQPLPDATNTAGTTSGGAGTFTNPVLKADFADPFVLRDGDTYYAFATNVSGKNVQSAQSKDLVHWELESDVMPALPSWAKLGGSFVWAPEVMKIGDKFVMYYTARDKASNKQCIGVATSDKPEGKYKDTNTAPIVCQADEGGTIDSSPFRDGDKLYLYYKNDGNCCGLNTYLYVQEMAPDGLSLVGEATRLVHNDRAWEGRVVEAPTMWKQDGKYYLFFSANNYAGFEYAVGYANCETAVGPCEDAPENPILASRMQQKPLVIGPGHQTITVDDDGETWIVYHVWNVTEAGLRGSNRFMWIDRLTFEGGKPVVQGPTTDPQPVP
jgi:beta-xylosidase